MNLLQEALIALLSGLTTKNEDGSINWASVKITPLNIEKQTYIMEDAYSTKRWLLNDKLHRKGGPAIEYADSTEYWYLNGQCHREDGPAVKYAGGGKEWWVNGKLHRIDGPAVEHVNGRESWYLNGQQYTEEEWLEKVK